jgi:hypothetical protein
MVSHHDHRCRISTGTRPGKRDILSVLVGAVISSRSMHRVAALLCTACTPLLPFQIPLEPLKVVSLRQEVVDLGPWSSGRSAKGEIEGLVPDCPRPRGLNRGGGEGLHVDPDSPEIQPQRIESDIDDKSQSVARYQFTILARMSAQDGTERDSAHPDCMSGAMGVRYLRPDKDIGLRLDGFSK